MEQDWFIKDEGVGTFIGAGSGGIDGAGLV